MSLEEALNKRSESKCELCSAQADLNMFELFPEEGATENNRALLCSVCSGQIENLESAQPNHWRCLSSSMWSEHVPVKILSYHMLSELKSEGWALELLDQMYMEEDELALAKKYHSQMGGSAEDDGEFALDSNGAKLFAGDSVTLIKDLDVKGANFTAKRGTLVKNIGLTGDTANIEGKINGTQIVLKTQFLKKAN